MRSLLAKTLGTSIVCVAGAVLFSSEAQAVAAFTRQTGMSCNHCHTLHGAPTPNFTFTGRKFKAVGYRLPGNVTGSTQERVHEQGEPRDRGEFLNILPTTFSGRMQWTPATATKSAATGDWGDVITNPTSRLAFFPFVGPIGHHFGVWTEFYLVPFTSEDSEWGIADTSYEEFDFRYIINPGNKQYTIGLALSNQSVYELFGFGPFPAQMPSYINRGVVGGYSHPNKAQFYVYGWMNDRWVWAAGADTGDTNHNWGRGNAVGLLGYAFRNRNDNELWLNIVGRTGSDALPLVTANGAQASSRSWQYRDAVGGISNTRRVDPNDPASPCLPSVMAGRRPVNSCAYIAEEMDSFSALDLEMRWGAQNVDRFFGQRSPGSWSFEMVWRVTRNTEDYFDGAKAKRNTWGFQPVIGWKHTYYIKPLIYGDFDYEFTDMNGTRYDIDTKTGWNMTVAYKPVENFLIYASYANNQSLTLTDPARSGRTFTITADLSF